MVLDHWSNDAMVSMDRCGLMVTVRRRIIIEIVNVDNDGEDGDGGICVNLARDLQ